MAIKRHAPVDLMARAVQEMQLSVEEKRKDGKKSPAVGVVLWRPDGEIETAHRGELRDGDHAEFTLLERKNRSRSLDGCVLYTTLEPCAPGARNPPKLSCAERIVLARIKKVWVGIEDPDPAVDRKGIKYLQDNGVDVGMFDSMFQETIREVNKEFIAQAVERAVAKEVKRKPMILSSLEAPAAHTGLSDFSAEAMKHYRDSARIEESIDSDAFRRRLLHQGLLRIEGNRRSPSGFGMVLLGKAPRDLVPQSGLLGTIKYPNDKEETRDFNGPLVMVPDQVEAWLSDKLPNTIDRSHMRRRERSELPFELIREAVVNALVHRDYDIRGAKCQLIVTAETIVVKSPGGPIEPITLAQIQAFDSPTLSRNPVIHYVFARMELAEERGLGLRSLKKRAEDLGLPLPRFTWEAPYLVLTMYRNPESATQVLDESIASKLTKEELEGWKFIAGRLNTTQKEYAGHLKVTARTGQRHLGRFIKLGLLRREGHGPATVYRVVSL